MNPLRAIQLLIVLALIAPAKPVLAEDYPELGRLFLTPERRAALERQRQLNIQEVRALEGATLRLDGVVRRSSGKSTVWLNGTPQNEDVGSRGGITVRIAPSHPGSAQIVPGDEAPTQLKVGESINRATGERDNRLGGGVLRTPTQR